MKRKVFEEKPENIGAETAFAERLARWCDEKRKAKDRLGYSNDDVAEETGVSTSTIGRIMAGNMDKDIRWSTVIALDRLLPSPGKDAPGIPPDVAQMIKAFEVEAAHIREDAAREIALYKDKIAALEAQASEMKTLITTRGDFIKKLIDKID